MNIERETPSFLWVCWVYVSQFNHDWRIWPPFYVFVRSDCGIFPRVDSEQWGTECPIGKKSHQNKPRINHLLTALQSHLTTPPPFRWWQQDFGEDPRIQTSQLDSACSMMRTGLWNRPYLSLHEYVFQIRHSWEIAHSWFRQRIAIKRDQGSSRTSTLITSSHWLWTIFYSELAS